MLLRFHRQTLYLRSGAVRGFCARTGNEGRFPGLAGASASSVSGFAPRVDLGEPQLEGHVLEGARDRPFHLVVEARVDDEVQERARDQEPPN